MTTRKKGLPGVEAELKSFLDDLPKYKESIKDMNTLLSIIDESISMARNVLDGTDSGSLQLQEKLSVAMIKQHLQEVEKERKEIGREVLQHAPDEETPSLLEPVPSSTASASDLLVEPLGFTPTTRQIKRNERRNRFGRDEVLWNQRFEELREYKKVHGNCDVPSKYTLNKPLGYWVKHQRTHYSKKKDGLKTPLTNERIRALESIGFRWRLAPPRSMPPRIPWEDRLEELKQYKAEHGDCHVPQHYSKNKSLGEWVSTQRKQYKLYMKGEASSMTRSRALALQEIGFKWSIGRGRGRKPN